MVEDGEIVIEKLVISEGKIVEFLDHYKENKQLSIEQALSILRNQNAVRYFKYNTDKYCELHEIALGRIEDSGGFIDFLKHECTFQRVITERDDFYSNFFGTLLLPLIKTSAKFKSDGSFEETSRTIQKCIFSRNFKQFDNYLSQLFEKNKSVEKCNLCKVLFKFITSLYSDDAYEFGFKLIYHSFSNAYNNFGFCYKFLIILMEIIGFNLKDELNISKIKYQVPVALLSKSLIVLNELLNIITTVKIELDYKVNNVSFSDFIKNCLQSLISLTKVPNTVCYQLLLKMAEINPLIIEASINEIMTYMMLSKNTECKQEYEEVMIKILEVFSKLSRIQSLISKMVPTLKSGIENRVLNDTVYTFKGALDIDCQVTKDYDVDEILPRAVMNYFTNCVISLASWQVINLFKTLLHHLNKAVEELPEFKGESAKQIYIEILSTLTCWILLSVRMAEHTVASTSVEKFVGGLEELRTILGNFGMALLHKEHNHVLMRAFLNICYYWAEIYITLEYYSISNNINMKKIIDNNLSSCNLTYLHSYLSCKEWCLISERITNFGEKPCKEIMLKLVIQKLRAILIFENNVNEDLTEPIIRDLATKFQEDQSDIFMDRFIVNSVLEKMPSSVIVSLSEVILKDFLDGNVDTVKKPHIHDSQLLTNGILCVIFSKINKLLKQKRKHDETAVKKLFFSRIMSDLPFDVYLNNDVKKHFEKATEILLFEEDGQIIDVKIHGDKIQKYLETLEKLPIIFSSEDTQKLIILLLFSLHRDIHNSNCDVNIRRSCETLIISIVQHNKFNLFDLVDVGIFLKMLIKNFERCDDLFSYIVYNVFKQDEAIDGFRSGIEFIEDNIKESKCLKFATIILNILNKIKKVRISTKSKELCSEYKSQLCTKMAKIISKKEPEDYLIEPYAVVLKTVLAKDEADLLPKLKSCWSNYVEYSLSVLNNNNLKGSLVLFTTILRHKAILTEFDDNFVLRIWNHVKMVTIRNEVLEEYSQLVTLIVSLIPNDQFLNIFQDLFTVTEKSIDHQDDEKFCQHLKTWSCIISTNFNQTKTNILREQLEFLLEKLILMVKCVGYKEDLFEEVIQFETAIIQANHVPLTSAIVDFLLLTVTILMTKKATNFIHAFDLSILLMENLLRHRNALIMDRLPPYLLQFRTLLKALCANSSSNIKLEPNQVQRIADCAHKLEKLTKSLVECSKDMSRISMYLIADILEQYEVDTLYPNVKLHLNNCIYSFVSLCDQHSVHYLMRVLSNASTEIFKLMYENYKKYYRFTGKV